MVSLSCWKELRRKKAFALVQNEVLRVADWCTTHNAVVHLFRTPRCDQDVRQAHRSLPQPGPCACLAGTKRKPQTIHFLKILFNEHQLPHLILYSPFCFKKLKNKLSQYSKTTCLQYEHHTRFVHRFKIVVYNNLSQKKLLAILNAKTKGTKFNFTQLNTNIMSLTPPVEKTFIGHFKCTILLWLANDCLPFLDSL